ncbi:ubiquitin-specific protease ubp15 [Batrachochytrium dendrobatidis]
MQPLLPNEQDSRKIVTNITENAAVHPVNHQQPPPDYTDIDLDSNINRDESTTAPTTPTNGLREMSSPVVHPSLLASQTSFPEAPPIEPEDLDSINNYGQQVVDQIMFKWDIADWSSIPDRLHSPEFTCGGCRWKILLFPRGNKQPEHVSAFLESVDAAERSEDKPEWHCCVSFGIRLANTENNSNCTKNTVSQNRYTPRQTDWGFNMLFKTHLLSRLHNGQPILEHDRLSIIVSMKVLKDEYGTLWHDFIHWDSRKETGYVGIRNQGATCYLNSLLQSLYFTNYFRKATYLIPTDNDDPQKSVPYAMQRLFYNMQFAPEAASTTELTKSFGWDTTDAFYQHDVQELNRVLQDNLESKMKGTFAEGAIRKLFTGKMKSYIKCVDVDFESSRIEDFYDIQLNVKGCKNLRDSFVEYCTVETMDGVNKYFAEGYGLQDARKGVIFHHFPPVLHLQLKRFEYDMERDSLVKINDRHEFPLTIDLDEFLEEPDSAVKQRYHLHGVLVHSGELHAGHYQAFIRPEKDGKWFKYDDDRVFPVSERDVLEENYGTEAVKPLQEGGIPPKFTGQFRNKPTFTNAYMLVYIREHDLEEILGPITEHDIPDHLRRRVEEERLAAERRKRDKEEAHLYCNVCLITEDDMRHHEGYDLCSFDEKNPSSMHIFRIRKADTFAQFKSMVSDELRVPVEQLRLWNVVSRQNKTVRPDTPLQSTSDELTMEVVRSKVAKGVADLRFYAEVSDKPISQLNDKAVYFMPYSTITPPPQLLLFIKYYDPIAPKLEFLSSITVRNKNHKISEIIPELLALKHLPPLTPILLYEEIKVGMVDSIKPNLTFSQAEIGDGDIICFQRDFQGEEITQVPDAQLLTAPGYYELLANRIIVTFKPKSKDMPNKGEFELVLSRKMLYDAVTDKIAKLLDLDPFKIRLWGSNHSHSMVTKGPIRRTTTTTLAEMLNITPYTLQAQQIIYYEMLDVSILEFETKRYIKVFYVDAKLIEKGRFDMLMLKTSKVGDVLEGVASRIGMPVAEAKTKLRLFDSSNSRVTKVYENDEPISVLLDSFPLIVEEICEDELNRTAADKLVSVCHFFKDIYRGHGIPFQFILKPGEMFSQTKKRLQARSSLNDRDFGKVVFYFITERTQSTPIEDDDILHDRPIGPNDLIGMDHPDKTARIRYGAEKSIKILN